MTKKVMLLVAVFLGSWVATPAQAQTYYQKQQGQNGAYFVPVSVANHDSEYGIHGGDVMISGFGGYSRNVNKVDGVDWGRKGGVTYGGSVLIFPASIFGVGVEYKGTQFSEVKCGGERIGLNYFDEYAKVKTDNIFLALRFNVNPNNRVRFYFPLGAGVSFQRIESRARSTFLTVKETDKEHGFAYYCGLGLETSLTKNLVLGIETRFQGEHIKKDDFLSVSGLAKLGVKF